MKQILLSILAAGILAPGLQAQPPKPTAPNTATNAPNKGPGNPPGTVPATPPGAPAPTDFSKIFKSDKEKNGYAIGMSYGMGLKDRLKDVDYDADALAKAFKEGLAGNPTLITVQQENEILKDLTAQMRKKQADKQKEMVEKQKEMAEKTKAEGAAFLTKNKLEPGVTTLTNGLQYKVITAGSGDMPKATDEVTVNYRGTLVDGTEFDASKPGNPISFKVGGVIKGWTQALQLMKTGSKWKLFIPSDLAYGERGSPPKIAGNSVLIFDVELVSIKPAPAIAPPPAPAPAHAAAPATPPAALTSDIIKVPSQEEIKKGAKIEYIKAEDVEKAKATNSTTSPK